jgi:DNA-binding MarR family transcriptional regulator
MRKGTRAADQVDVVVGQWRRERPDADPTPMGVVGRIQRANRLLERGLREEFARHGLQLWEFDLLATLRRSGAPYRLTAGALTDSAMITSGAVTNRVDRLTAQGLVTREVDPRNRRSIVITLTPAGRELMDAILAAHLANERRLLAALSPAQQRQLQDLLRTLLIGLGDGATVVEDLA